MDFQSHHYDLEHGQEDVIVQLGCHKLVFEKPEDIPDDEEDECNDTIVDISTNHCGMKLALNQYNHSTFQFYNQRCNEPVMTIHGHKLDMHNHQIKEVANPTCSQDVTNKQYVQLFDLPIATILPYYGLNPPNYYLICNGDTFDQNQYPDLYIQLGSNILPDLRGLFVRGYDPTNRYDPDSRTIGSVQTDSIKAHTHTYVNSYASGSVGWAAVQQSGPALRDQQNATQTTSSTGISETRGVNMCLNYIIKAKKINLYGEY